MDKTNVSYEPKLIAGDTETVVNITVKPKNTNRNDRHAFEKDWAIMHDQWLQ